MSEMVGQIKRKTQKETEGLFFYIPISILS